MIVMIMGSIARVVREERCPYGFQLWEVCMVRATVVMVVLTALVLSTGLAIAQAQKSEGVMGAVKNVIPGMGEKKDAAAADTSKGNTGLLDKAKGLINKKDAASADSQKENTGLLDKAKGAIAGTPKPADEKKCGGMLDKVKGIIPCGVAK